MIGDRRGRIAVGVAAALVAGGVAWTVLGDDGDADEPSPAEEAGFPSDLPPGTIGAWQREYVPEEPFTVTVGDAVVFENTDDVPHTFTADDGLFDSGVVEPDGRYEINLDGPRTVAFHCDIHPDMRGTVTIG